MDDCTIIDERRVFQIPKNQKEKIARNDKYTSININSMTIVRISEWVGILLEHSYLFWANKSYEKYVLLVVILKNLNIFTKNKRRTMIS